MIRRGNWLKWDSRLNLTHIFTSQLFLGKTTLTAGCGNLCSYSFASLQQQRLGVSFSNRLWTRGVQWDALSKPVRRVERQIVTNRLLLDGNRVSYNARKAKLPATTKSEGDLLVKKKPSVFSTLFRLIQPVQFCWIDTILCTFTTQQQRA